MNATAAAGVSSCTSSICRPNPDGTIDIRRPLNGPQPVTVCDLFGNWTVNTVVSFVTGYLKVHFLYTWVPAVVCRVVG
jgi:hypothetical protein